MSASRVPKGVPTGGQFAASTRDEAPGVLAESPDASAVDAADPFQPGQHGKIAGGGTWATYRQPQGASFNPWLGELRIHVGVKTIADVETDEEARRFGRETGDRLAALPFYQHDAYYEDAVDYLQDADTIEEVSAALDEVYDWGDSRRYIIEFKGD